MALLLSLGDPSLGDPILGDPSLGEPGRGEEANDEGEVFGDGDAVEGDVGESVPGERRPPLSPCQSRRSLASGNRGRRARRADARCSREARGREPEDVGDDDVDDEVELDQVSATYSGVESKAQLTDIGSTVLGQAVSVGMEAVLVLVVLVAVSSPLDACMAQS
jgi:hypothetical protein